MHRQWLGAGERTRSGAGKHAYRQTHTNLDVLNVYHIWVNKASVKMRGMRLLGSIVWTPTFDCWSPSTVEVHRPLRSIVTGVARCTGTATTEAACGSQQRYAVAAEVDVCSQVLSRCWHVRIFARALAALTAEAGYCTVEQTQLSTCSLHSQLTVAMLRVAFAVQQTWLLQPRLALTAEAVRALGCKRQVQQTQLSTLLLHRTCSS